MKIVFLIAFLFATIGAIAQPTNPVASGTSAVTVDNTGRILNTNASIHGTNLLFGIATNAPSNGKVLTATSPTTAKWDTSSGGVSVADLEDSTNSIYAVLHQEKLDSTNALGSAAWHPASDFYLSSNPSFFVTETELSDATNSALAVATSRINSATNKLDIDLRSAIATAKTDATNKLDVDLRAAIATAKTDATNKLDVDLRAALLPIHGTADLAVKASYAGDVSTNQLPQSAITNQTPRNFGFGVNGDGAAIQAGTYGSSAIDFTGTITACKLYAQPSGSVRVELWRTNSATGSFPPTVAGSIGTNALTSASAQIDSTLTGWTTLVSSGDVFFVNIPTNALSITNLTMILKVQP